MLRGLWLANHVSWLDIPAVHVCVFSRFVAKRESASWPIAGPLARAVDTLFIRRGIKSQTRSTLQKMDDSLRRHDRITVFPEGTTTIGDTVLLFSRHTPAVALPLAAPI